MVTNLLRCPCFYPNGMRTWTYIFKPWPSLWCLLEYETNYRIWTCTRDSLETGGNLIWRTPKPQKPVAFPVMLLLVGFARARPRPHTLHPRNSCVQPWVLWKRWLLSLGMTSLEALSSSSRTPTVTSPSLLLGGIVSIWVFRWYFMLCYRFNPCEGEDYRALTRPSRLPYSRPWRYDEWLHLHWYLSLSLGPKFWLEL